MLLLLPAYLFLSAWVRQSAKQLLCQWVSSERQQGTKRLKLTSLTRTGSVMAAGDDNARRLHGRERRHRGEAGNAGQVGVPLGRRRLPQAQGPGRG